MPKKAIIRCVKYLGIFLGIIVVLFLGLAAYTIFFIEHTTPESAAPASTIFVTVGNEKIATRQWPGTSSSTVVMVGGLSAWGDTWERTVLEQRRRGSTHTFVAIDLPPFGYSQPGDTADYSRSAQAQRIQAVIEQLGDQPVILLGHSYGGGPAAEVALTNPQRISKLLLISPVLNIGAPPREPLTGIFTNDTLRHVAVAAATRLKPLLLDRLNSFVYIKDNISYELLSVYTKPFATTGASRRLSNWIQTYVSDDVSKNRSTQIKEYTDLPYPVVLLWGEYDTLTPISQSEPLVEQGVQLITITGMGHIPMIEDIGRFNDVLAEHLTTEEAAQNSSRN